MTSHSGTLFFISNKDEQSCLHMYVVQNWSKILKLAKDEKYFAKTRERLKLLCSKPDTVSVHTDCEAHRLRSSVLHEGDDKGPFITYRGAGTEWKFVG